MLWQEQIKVIEELATKVYGLRDEMQRTVTQLESRKQTLENQIARLDADYAVMQARNANLKKESQKVLQLDIQQLEEGRRRVREREQALLQKEKEVARLKAELESAADAAKAIKEQKESVRRQYARD